MLQVGWGDVMEVGMEGCVCPEGPALLHVAQVLPSSEQVARLLVLCLLLDVVC